MGGVIPEEENSPPSDSKLIEEIHAMLVRMEPVIQRVHPLLDIAEGLAKTKARFTGWAKK